MEVEEWDGGQTLNVEQKIICIDEISSGACERGIFRILFKGKLVEDLFSVYPANDQYDSEHHLEYSDIISLNYKYPNEIILCEQDFALESWGNKIKYGLSQLIKKGKFNRVVEKGGKKYYAVFNWVGEDYVDKPIQKIKKPRKNPAGLR